MVNPFQQELQRREGGGASSGNPFRQELEQRQPQRGEGSLDDRAAFVGQSGFGPPDIGFTDRMRVESGDTFEEQRNIFQRQYPEGNLERLPATGELVFRRDPSEAYRLLNPEGADPTDVGALISDTGPIIGEVLGATIGRPATFLRSILQGSIGAGIGEGAEQVYQTVTGTQEQTPSEQVGEAGAESLFSLGGGAIGAGAGKVADALMGGGLFRLKEGGREALRAARELGVDSPLPGQTTRSSILSRIQGQAGQTAPVIQERVDRLSGQLVSQLDNLSALSPGERLRAVDTIAEGFDLARDRTLRTLVESTRDVPPEEAGRVVQGAIEQYRRNSRQTVNDLYETARSFEDPTFNLETLQKEASDVARRTTVRTQEGGEEPISDALGEVRQIAQQIQRADPRSVGTDQLNAWEQRLFDLSQPTPGAERTTAQKRAASLRGAVRRTFDDPENTSPAFREAWQKARGAAKTRFDTLEDSFVVASVRSDRPREVARNLLGTDVDPQTIRVMRRVASPEQFREIQNAFKTQLLENPDRISEAVSNYDPGALRSLLSPEEIRVVRRTGEQIDRLNKANINRGLERQEEFMPLIQELSTGQGQTARIAALREFVEDSGGLDSPVGRVIRAGVARQLFNKAVRETPSGQAMNPASFNKAIRDFRDRGMLDLLNQEDQRTVGNLVRVLQFADPMSEGVSNLLGATAVSQALRPRPSVDALMTLIRNFGIGRAIVSGPGKFLIQGTARGRLSPRGAFVGGAQATQDIMENLEELGREAGANREGQQQ